MNEPAVIVGRFHDLKYLLGARIARVIIELPLEEAAKVTAAFGHPDPNVIVDVVLARLKPQTTIEATAHRTIEPSPARAAGLIKDKPKRRFSEMSSSQQAGMLCADERFQNFIDVKSVDEAAEYVRDYCGVRSRADINTNPEATEVWLQLLRRFHEWSDKYENA